ncbi:MAG: glycosyltransferase family 4 protein [Acidimicrobiales bacterium]
MPHVLVTNDFPPKFGGIQSYLYELWRRLPAGMATVYTTAHEQAAEFDRAQALRIVRSERSLLLPTSSMVSIIDRLARETGSGLVVLDPALPLGLLGPRLAKRYGVIVHGAEITVPGRLPLARPVLGHVLSSGAWLLAGGTYPAAEAHRAAGGRLPAVTQIPPGVDITRFRPLSGPQRLAAREHLGLPRDSVIVLGLGRLVPRKGMDVLIRAVSRLQGTRPELVLVIGGSGRDEPRLRAIASSAGVRVKWLGSVSEIDKPLVYGAADVYAMCCRDRWFGLEQEGFGIVFLEAAACGIPQLAGESGGSAEAVVNGETGIVVSDPGDYRSVARALEPLLDDVALRERFGAAARARAVTEFDYDKLAGVLQQALIEAGG